MLLYVHQFLINLLFSAVIEAVVATSLYRILYRAWRIRPSLAAIAGTALTIPYVWFVFPTLLWAAPMLILIAGEAFAVIVETFFYRYICSLTLKQALLFSVGANAASYYLGILLNAYIR